MSLLQLCLPDAEELTLLKILHKRTNVGAEEIDFLLRAVDEGCLSDDEAVEAGKIEAQQKAHKDQADALRPFMEKLQKDLAKKAHPCETGGGPAQKKAKSVGKGKGAPPVPCIPRGPDCTLEEMQRLAPAGSRLYKDAANNRWRGFYQGRNMSRSWVCRASVDAAMDVVRFLWAQHTSITGEKCPIAGV